MAKVELPEGLIAEVEKAAQAQGRTVDEVLSEAVQRYIDDQKWQKLIESGECRAKARGLTENDVARLIEEVRRENRTRRTFWSC
jgi:metal-responsive CopG/Arc/MetJ family transcriptional regulator